MVGNTFDTRVVHFQGQSLCISNTYSMVLQVPYLIDIAAMLASEAAWWYTIVLFAHLPTI